MTITLRKGCLIVTEKASAQGRRKSTSGGVASAIDFVDSEEMARASNMKIVSFRVALTRSRRRRAEDRSIPTDIPEPDFYVGRSPVWHRKSLDAWIVERGTAKAALILRSKQHAKAV